MRPSTLRLERFFSKGGTSAGEAGVTRDTADSPRVVDEAAAAFCAEAANAITVELVVVIPAFNEERSVAAVVASVP